MAINVQDLISAKARKFGASESSTDFIQTCIDSINYIISDINERLYTETVLVDSADDTIDLDQSTYQGLISLGLDYYLADTGSWTIQNLDGVKARYLDKMKTVQMNYQKSTVDMKVRFGNIDDAEGDA